MKSGERIAIFGDYDADGIPGASLLYSMFKVIGYENFEAYIPDRYTEQYSLSKEVFDKFKDHGVSLVITVDCGITDIEQVDRASELGIDVIITDHHLPHKTLPKAYAVINNKREDDKYSYKYLCGAGTAWKLAQALLRAGKFDTTGAKEKWLMDLVAISTVCDMVALTGENRAIVQLGLKVLAQEPTSGIASTFC